MISKSRAAPGAALVMVLVAGLAGYHLVTRTPARRSPGAVQNILLISVDTLRADHLGSHGYGRPTSPNIDRLGGEGVVFENAVAQSPSTLPSHASIFTSRYASQHRTIKDGLDYTELHEEELTLAEILKKKGYRTAAFTDGGETARVFNLDQGFDLYDDTGGGIERINARVFSWLRGNGRHKFFLFVHCYDTHAPYTPVPPFDRMFPAQSLKVDLQIKNPTAADEARFLKKTVADYDAEIAYTDQHTSALLARLRRLGLSEKTLVIFTSDHGEEFLEHRRLGHSEQIYDESIRVPLIFHNRALLPPRRISPVVGGVDIAPTILDLLGIPIPGRMMGRSLRGLMRGDPAPAQPAFAENEHRVQYAIRTSRHKLIVDGEKKRHYLFDLARDPGEQRDLAAASRPGEYRDLLQKLMRWRHQVSRPDGVSRPTRSLAGDRQKHKKLLEQLRSLGYIQ